MIISQPKEMIGAFVNVRQNFPPETSWGTYNALGLVSNGTLVAGVIYNCFEGANVNMHIGAVEGSKWMTQDFLHAAFDYPFNQLNRRRVSACINSHRKKAISFVENLGFEYEGLSKNFYENGDLLRYGMLRENCRFIKDTFRKAA
jgi:RimJ/RimL family protein N-acetyltransferase